MSAYEQWMQVERSWMAAYRKKQLRTSVCLVLPLTALLLGGLMALSGGMSGSPPQETLEMFLTGAVSGALLAGLFILCQLPGLSAGRLRRGLRRAAARMGLTEAETGQMAGELLAAAQNPAAHFDFTLTGPGSSGTPASFYATPHFAYLRGGSPLVNIARISADDLIRPEEEQKTATVTRAKSKTITRFTLYTICFYSRQRAAGGVTPDTPADAAMGFFSEELRDRALQMIESQRQPPQIG